ncbi:MAG: PAS domain S-box protein [Acidobacteria bacterium]|nr:PAS domain S-box protein [Acidobacteriota bacterium]MCA1640765.1 PAS domain S-box protein [Acidobacteriota bacterium]
MRLDQEQLAGSSAPQHSRPSCAADAESLSATRSALEALRHAEAQYRSIFDNSLHGIYQSTPEGRFLNVNTAFARMLGYDSPEEMIESFHSIDQDYYVDPSVRARLKETFESGGAVQGFECQARRRDGSVIWTRESFYAVRDSTGALLYYEGAVEDITEHKLAEIALQESEERYRRLFADANDIIYTTDLEGNYTSMNSAGEALTGYSCDEIRRMNFRQITAPEFVERVRGMLEKELRGEETTTCYETEIVSRAGARLNLEVSTQLIRAGDGKPCGIQGIARDVTARKRLEAERQVLSEIIQGVNATSNLEELLALVHRSLGKILYAENCFVALIDRESGMLNMQFFVDEFDTCPPPQQIGRGRTAYVFRTSRPALMTEDVFRALAERGEVEMVGTPPAVWLGVPLKTPSATIGVLVVQHYRDPQAYSAHDTEFLASVGSQIAIAIERKRAEEALRGSEERYRELFENANDVVYTHDLSGNFTSLNKTGERVTGYTREEACRINLAQVVVPEYVSLARKMLGHKQVGEESTCYELEIFAKDGRRVPLEISTRLIYRDGAPVGVQGIARDITERRQSQRSLEASEAELRALFAAMTDVILVLDREGRYLKIAPTNPALLYQPPAEMLGRTLHEVLPREQADEFLDYVHRALEARDTINFEYRLDVGGSEHWFAGTVSPMIDDAVIWVARDITERKRAEAKLIHIAFHDSLTGLPNRALFTDHLKLAIASSKRTPAALFAVLFLDLDRFKVINDSLGHPVGDELLVSIARRLEHGLRAGDTVARLGGDEFAILLNNLDSPEDALRVAERVQEQLAEPLQIGGYEVFTTASIGIALSTTGYTNEEDVLRDADTVMYRAKAEGAARYEVFDQVMHARVCALLKLENDLRRAIERKEFCLYYQPIVALSTGRITGFEALVRWTHPERGLVPPSEFIPLAEETGLIVPLGMWVLEAACRQMREWHALSPHHRDLKLSVNLSGRQFAQADLLDRITRVLRETEFDPRCLQLELTESVVMDNAKAIVSLMGDLRALGLELAIDDFGTGYSSLSYLQRFPIHTLKIDRSFISPHGDEDRENSEIVRTIILLARNMGKDVVAEGVETEEQLARLRDLDCEYGQGYIFSRPQDAEATESLLREALHTGLFLDPARVMQVA